MGSTWIGSRLRHIAPRPCRLAVTQRTVRMSSLHSGEVFFLDNFAVRQFDDPNYSGTRISYDKAEFVKRIHEFHSRGAQLVDGYAPFCKHIFVPNFVSAKLGALRITDENKHLLRSGYTKRRPEELAILSRRGTGSFSPDMSVCFVVDRVQPCRWFPSSQVVVPEAQHLDIILYSREQLLKEYADMPTKTGGDTLPPAAWGIISIKAQDESFETPMQPITIMRNALGREEGGSGVKLDKAAYEKSVAYWQDHAALADGDNPTGG